MQKNNVNCISFKINGSIISVFTSVNLVIVYSPNVMIPVKGTYTCQEYRMIKQVAVALAFQAHTGELPGSNLGQNFRTFVVFPECSRDIPWIDLQHRRFLPWPFQFSIHHSPFQSLDTDITLIAQKVQNALMFCYPISMSVF